MRLYEIVIDLETLLEAYNATEDDTERQAIADKIAALEISQDEKLNGCCKWLQKLRAESKAIKEETNRLMVKQGIKDNEIRRFENYISRCLGEGNKWDNGIFRISWRESQSVQVTDPSLIPGNYLRENLSYEPDKVLIKKDLEIGADIPGVELVKKQSIQIR
jgi:hypothetical protein